MGAISFLSKSNTANHSKLDDNLPLRILDLKMFAKEHTATALESTELYNFKAQYALGIHKVDKYVTTTLKSLRKSKKIIDSIYAENKKHNVNQSRKNIKKWIDIAELYLVSLNKKEIRCVLDSAADFKFTLYSLISHKNKILNFQTAYAEYKITYNIPDSELVDLDEFKLYLDLNYLRLDEKSFRNTIYALGVCEECDSCCANISTTCSAGIVGKNLAS